MQRQDLERHDKVAYEWMKKFCSKCGALYREEAEVCAYCSTKLKERR